MNEQSFDSGKELLLQNNKTTAIRPDLESLNTLLLRNSVLDINKTTFRELSAGKSKNNK